MSPQGRKEILRVGGKKKRSEIGLMALTGKQIVQFQEQGHIALYLV